jgi:hypothetical protein
VLPFLSGNRLLTYLAWANVIVHVIALALAVLGMRPGSPAVDLEARRAYLAGGPLTWSLGWGSWMICTVLLVAFCAELARHLPGHPDAARLAVTLACAGAAVDLFCDSLFITVLPAAAAGGKETEALFLALERLGEAGGLIVANGLYTVAVLILVLCLRRRPGLAPLTTEAGAGVVVFGLLLSAAGFTGVAWHAEVLTVATIGCFCVWVVLVARSFAPAGKNP